jgi:L-threonylcarbamoyladenylate synthase
VPSDPIALALITEFEKISNSAIAAPSANRFGQVSPTSCADVQEELGEYLSSNDLVLDGGNSVFGIESTIIDCTGTIPAILRSGLITKELIESKVGNVWVGQIEKSNTKFSGSFKKHYAPKCSIIPFKSPIYGAGFLALKEIKTPPGMIRLATPVTVEEYAHILYSTFRAADHHNLEVLAIIPPEGEGLAVAINEKIEKASLGR